MSYTTLHKPVLLNEVRDELMLRPGMVVVDGTVGDGGHSAMMLEQVGATGLVVGLDRDPEAVRLVQERFKNATHNFVAAVSNFSDLPSVVPNLTPRPVDRVLLDLGWSTTQFMLRQRGFSFLTNEPLDMRFNPNEEVPTAAEILAKSSEEELTRIFRLYGEENRAEQIATAIRQSRERQPITTTQQLANIVVSVAPRQGKKHPATQVFQALRIAVNDELGVLQRSLVAIKDFLPSGARLAVITFHSLEDRIVKQFGVRAKDLKICNKKPIIPTLVECRDNPRARSSKLRVFEKI